MNIKKDLKLKHDKQKEDLKLIHSYNPSVLPEGFPSLLPDAKTILVIDQGKDLYCSLIRELGDQYDLLFTLEEGNIIKSIENMKRPDLVIYHIPYKPFQKIQFPKPFHEVIPLSAIPIILLIDQRDSRLEALQAGAIECLYKPIPMDILKSKIKSILTLLDNFIEQYLKDFNYFRTSRIIHKNSEKELNRYNLTKSEKKIVRLVIKGLPNKEIAYQLRIAVGTVKAHLNRIFAKMEIGSRFELFNKVK